MKYSSIFSLCCLLSLSISMSASAVQSSTPDIPVSFAHAWDFVSQYSNAIQAQHANVKSAQAKQDAAKDLYLPKITLNGTYTHLNEPVSLETSSLISSPILSSFLSSLPSSIALTEQNIYSSSITALWPLFTGGRIDAAQIIAQGMTDEAQALMKMKQQERFETLTKVYFGTILAKKVAETYMDVELDMQAHYQNAKKLEKQGQIAHVERLSAQAQYDTAKVNAKKAQRSLAIAQVALNQMLRKKQDNQSQYMPDAALFINQALPPLSEFIDATLKTYPGLQILAAKKKQVGGLIQVQKGRYYPTVAAFGSYNVYKDDSLTSDLEPDWYVGVNVSMDLIDSSGRGGELDAAYEKKEQVTYLTEQAHHDLRVLVEKTYKNAQQSIEEYQGLISSRALAQESLRLRKLAFAQGMATSVQVSDAETFLQSIQTRRLLSAYKYVIALSQLLALSDKIDTFSQYQNTPYIEVHS